MPSVTRAKEPSLAHHTRTAGVAGWININEVNEAMGWKRSVDLSVRGTPRMRIAAVAVLLLLPSRVLLWFVALFPRDIFHFRDTETRCCSYAFDFRDDLTREQTNSIYRRRSGTRGTTCLRESTAELCGGESQTGESSRK